MGVRNRTIERAPTKPKERAKEDLTILIIKVVVSNMKGNIQINSQNISN